MSLFARILDVHQDWVIAKHYDEVSLSSPEPKGAFMKRLTEAFQEVVNDAFMSSGLMDLSVPTTGYFGADKDPVHYKFNFEYDPNGLKLHLCSLEARMQGEPQVYMIPKDQYRALPDAQTVYQRLHLVEKKNLPQALQARPSPAPGKAIPRHR
ncbi:hypothetical protein [Dinghuibacter silviterrae]|uniref:Uncharacterized protein n=1 Tax=Dinghuibacter silviterrae TaxID=1539049 RepID=A0A4V3GKV3_9BACT|nr:hypothetical protein [Dinghuibacter silviterrae]TDW97102.1 hypothetical protein EDB95_4943 [Dinghuibacter silviterrae]